MGKKGKVKRVRRCYITDPNQRDICTQEIRQVHTKIILSF